MPEDKVLLWGDGNDTPTLEWVGQPEDCPIEIDRFHYWMSYEEVGDPDYYGHGPACNCGSRFCQ